MRNLKSRSWIEVDLDAIGHNVKCLQSFLKDDDSFMAVVKADAYGHGSLAVSLYLQTIGVNAFAVATIDEAIALRKNFIKGDILILGYTHPSRCQDIQRYNLIQTVVDKNHGIALNEQNVPIRVHVKVDTGMHRLGIEHIEDIGSLYQCQYLHIEGFFTHLCVCDSQLEEDKEFTKHQITSFYQCINEIKKDHHVGKIHIQSSYGLVNYPEVQCDYARIGILMYGVHSSFDSYMKHELDLKPALSIYSHIAMIHEVDKGESIGYGHTYTTQQKSRLAIIPIGYADGIPRLLSSQGYVLIKGKKCFIVGRICMDQMIVDVTHVQDAQCNDRVTIIGRDLDNEIRVETMAFLCNSISNEILSRLGSRLYKVYKGHHFLKKNNYILEKVQ